MFQQTSNPQYSQFIALSRYARFDDNLGRREMWPETVSRLTDFWVRKHPEQEKYIKEDIHNAILNLEVMPSMRSLMTAGKALDKCNVAGYNCSFVAIESPRDFDEILYVLMNGTGVGFSVERQSVNKLPEVAESFYDSDTVIHVKDSKLGWAKSFKELLSLLWQGEIPKWDMSEVRPKGARLKTFGGRASGPEPLDALFRFSVNMFKKAKGRKLTSTECHDLVCKIAEIVVVGGVRRSALISLSNLSDDRMRNAKSGQWWIDNPQRALANNSYVADERPDFEIFMEEWLSLYKSRSGERGIFSRTAAQKQAEKTGRREPNHDFGTNP
jgi:ribonucleoside-triphosphate reductase (thioredoxin)